MATLARTFVSFSSSDIGAYWRMLGWKAHERIDLNFADYQLDDAIDSRDEAYIKSRCRPKIARSDTFMLLIGPDTRFKTTYVKWEIEVAIEYECRLIGVNLDRYRWRGSWCPEAFVNVGALFVPYSSRTIARALDDWGINTWPRPGDWYFYDWVYHALGYQLTPTHAYLPAAPKPWEQELSGLDVSRK